MATLVSYFKIMDGKMNFFVIGVSHHQASVAVREKLAVAGIVDRLYGLWERGEDLSESLLLSTCNRLEFFAVSDRPELIRQVILDELTAVSGCPRVNLSPYLHEYADLEAARHLFRVAASLDSLVLGEPQILGQVKAAFREALKRCRVGMLISKLMHCSFRAAKRVRSETSLAGGPVSVAGAVTRLVLTLKDGDLSKTEVLILGAGPTAVLVLDNLKKKNPAALTILNRTRVKAEVIAQKYKINSRDWVELKSALAGADLVIAATGASELVLTEADLRETMGRRSLRPLIIVDIGVPRNVAYEVKYIENILLRNIDDLKEVVWESSLGRQEAAVRAEVIIEEEVTKFGKWLVQLAKQPILVALTRKAEGIRRLELQKTFSQHNFSSHQREVVEIMTGALVRRLLHDPLLFIKNSSPAEAGCVESGQACLNSIRRAFKL